jgi:hypothetical protein
MEEVGLFYGHLVYFTVIWYISRPFGIFYGHLVYFTAIWYILSSFGRLIPFWYVLPRKIWQPWVITRYSFFAIFCPEEKKDK